MASRGSASHEMMSLVMWNVIRKLFRNPLRSSKIQRQFSATMTTGTAQGTNKSVRNTLLKRHGHHRVDDAVPRRAQEDLITEEAQVIVEPDEAARRADHLVLQAQVDRREERIRDQEQDDQQGRGQKTPGQIGF